jgi:predicted regulator of Ras-like GTPase activity (Roadblock/LC7/MglB family)
MSFLEHLQSVVREVDGALACTIMGFDGIAIETHQVGSGANLDLASTCVEFGNVLAQARTAAEQLKTGAVSEVSVNTEKLTTLMRLITPEYFLVLALKPDGNHGKGRYALRIAAPRLRAEL